MLVKLFILGLPGSGKSAIARSIVSYLKLHQSSRKIHGQLSVIRWNDYAILDSMFRQDTTSQKFKPAAVGGFDVIKLEAFDEALQKLEQEVNAKLSSLEAGENMFTIVEFSRNDYQHAFKQFNKTFLTNAYFLYLKAKDGICRERIQQRVAHPKFAEDDHPVSDYIFKEYYYGDDGEQLENIFMREYQIDRRRIFIAENNGSEEEILVNICSFVDTMLENKVLAQSASRFPLEGDIAK